MTSPAPDQQASKPWFDIASYCVGALMVGTIAVASFAGLLSFYGSQESMPQAAAAALKFPETAQALDETAKQLDHDGKTLAGLEPAAGR